jgi:hypothetical protein
MNMKGCESESDCLTSLRTRARAPMMASLSTSSSRLSGFCATCRISDVPRTCNNTIGRVDVMSVVVWASGLDSESVKWVVWARRSAPRRWCGRVGQ